ncbi:MAG: Ig-like domain repeat protein [Thermoplasmata archaeon]|nr:Ig-like domain repeat protein [Thermoplasmata archaeon]
MKSVIKALIGIMIIALLTFTVLPRGGDSEDIAFSTREAPPDIIVDVPMSEPRTSTQFIDGKAWGRIDLDGSLSSMTQGGPALPRISYPMKVPYEIEDLRVVRADPVKFLLDHPLPPSPTLVPFTEEYMSLDRAPPLKVDWTEYTTNVVTPKDPLSWTHMGYGWDTGEKLSHYSISITPFDYRPLSGELTFYSDISLEIVVKQELPVRAMTRAVVPPGSLEEGTELLIVAPSSYLDDIQPYTEWNREKGTITTAVSMQTVDSTYPTMDDPSSLWQYIRDSFFGDGKSLKFVTLIGEVNQVPTRVVKDTNPYVAAGEPDHHAADTYFGCLDFTYQNWDKDKDGIWGEARDIIDYTQEVYVSRVPVNTESEAGGWALKVVKYEKNPNTGSWAGKAGLFGANTHKVNDGPDQCEYLWTEYLNGVYPTKAPYYSASTTQQSVGATILSYGNINSALNDGLGLVVYMGHGYYGAWTEGTHEGPSSTIFTTSTARSLSQSPKLPFITAMSCETNWFDYTSFESISEEFVENANGGAIGYIGAVRTTEGGIGYDIYYPGAPAIQEDVLRMIQEGKRSIAEIMAGAKEHYYESFGSYFFGSGDGGITYSVWMEHMALGPAEVEIWTDAPKSLQVGYDFDNDYYTNFTIEVKDGAGSPVNNAKVCIYSSTLNDQVVVTTGSNGMVTTPYVISQTAVGTITVTKTGYKPFQSDILMRDSTPPVTELDAKIRYPNGMDGWYLMDPEIAFSSSEPSDIQYRINGGYTYSYTGEIRLMQGVNDIDYWSVDSSENIEEVRTVQIKLDDEAPRAEVHMTPEEPDGFYGWHVTSPVIEVSLEESAGSDQRMEYWYKGEDKQTYEGPIVLEDGEQEIHIQASDNAGNRDIEHVFQLMVDTSFPSTRASTGGVSRNENGWYDQPFEITLRSDDSTADIQYRWNDDGLVMNYNGAITPEYGNNTLYYHSVDRAGNVEEEGYTEFAYDPDAPIVTHAAFPARPDGYDGWYTTIPRVSLSVENEMYGKTIFYRIEDGEWMTYISSIVLPEGKTTLLIYAVDDAGNRCPEIRLEFKVDTEIESTQYKVDALMGNGWYKEVPTITLTGEPGATIYYSWNDRVYERYMGALFPPEGEGMFTLTFYCMDDAGNREPERSITVNVDATAPESAMTYRTNDNWVNFNLSGSTDGVGVMYYFMDFGDGSDSGWVNTPLIQHEYLDKGDYTVEVKVKDEAGHESEVMEYPISLSGGQDIAILLMVLVLVVVVSIGAIALIAIYKHRHSKPHRLHFPHPHMPHPHLPHPHMLHPHLPHPPPKPPLPPQTVVSQLEPAGAPGKTDSPIEPATAQPTTPPAVRPAGSIGPDQTYQPPPPPQPPQRPSAGHSNPSSK